MSIIGIITKEKQMNQLKKEIEKQNINVEAICINSKSIENIRNVKFEIVIIQDELKANNEKIKEIIKNTKNVLLNTDININEDIFKEVNAKILTYGLKPKATITLSSIQENKVIVNIQRAFKNIEGKVIEQQEIPVELVSNNTPNLYNSLIKIAIINILSAKNR